MALTRFTTNFSKFFSDGTEHYRYESERLKSFEKWQDVPINPARFAAAGFYYTGRDETVKCFQCKIEIHEWQQYDDPMQNHRRQSRRCHFILNIPCGNVTIAEEDLEKMSSVMPDEGHDECGIFEDEENYTKHKQLKRQVFENTYRMKNRMYIENPYICAILPMYPEFIIYDDRLNTYHTWPKTNSKTKEELTAAGLFYSGKDDETVCYHCGGRFKDWEPEDDPWEQHVKLFSYCSFLYMIKGRDYVNKIRDKINEVNILERIFFCLKHIIIRSFLIVHL